MMNTVITPPLAPTTQADLRRRWLQIIPPSSSPTPSPTWTAPTTASAPPPASPKPSTSPTPAPPCSVPLLPRLLPLPDSRRRRRSARRLIFLALVSWGVLASLTGIIRSFWLLALDRLVLGAAESFILPGMLILLTGWFTRAERSRANTFLILGNPPASK